MKGWIYRRAVGLKDRGERLGHIQVFGLRPFTLLASVLICLGLALRGWVSKYPVN